MTDILSSDCLKTVSLNIVKYLFGMIVWVRVVFGKTVVGDQLSPTIVTNNSLSKDYLHLDNHTKQITDNPVFKPLIIVKYRVNLIQLSIFFCSIKTIKNTSILCHSGSFQSVQ